MADKAKVDKVEPEVIIPSYRVHVVEKGDTLRLLSQKYLGSPAHAQKLQRINDLHTDILCVGQKLNIPKA